MPYVCERIDLTPQHAVVIRNHIAIQDLPHVLKQSYSTLAAYLRKLEERPAGAPFLAYYSFDVAQLEIEAGLPVARHVVGCAPVQASTIPGGPVARCLHIGPYHETGRAYDALTQWVAAHGYELSGGAYEFYLNDPADTPPAALQTQIVLRLK